MLKSRTAGQPCSSPAAHQAARKGREDRTYGERDLDVSDVEIGALMRSGRGRDVAADAAVNDPRVRLTRQQELSAAIPSCWGCGPEPALGNAAAIRRPSPPRRR